MSCIFRPRTPPAAAAENLLGFASHDVAKCMIGGGLEETDKNRSIPSLNLEWDPHGEI